MNKSLVFWVLVTVIIVLALVVLSLFIVYQMGGRLYFSELKQESVDTFLGEINLASCSEGMVLRKGPGGWFCSEDKTVIAGGWEKDYDKSCSGCSTCGVFWGSGECASTTGTQASFECTQGKRVKIAEYGERERKTYWYQCLGLN
jgi:hypothetical protein